MGKSKIIYGGVVQMDLTQDTVTKEVLQKGYTAHGADGELITGENTFDVDSSGATAAVAEVLAGKTFAKGGKILTGTMPNRGAVSLKIKSKDEKVTIAQGYHDGSGGAEIDAIEKAKLIPANIREGVTVLGVAGSMSGSEDFKGQEKEGTPSTVEQVFLPDEGFNAITQFTMKAIPYEETQNAAGGITVTIG